ncbi:MAG: FtsQ-type POTRA domain-containing protein [Candidatus Caenarcaniphilales bacterium]|jgi:hypothetical protein|nr:FtsQ-type POTRA domain-containing protein [Candidatus Caenarcaniphilales bacterium]
MNPNALKKLAVFIALIIAIVLLLRLLFAPIGKLVDHANIYGLSLVSQEELVASLAKINYDHKKFIEINAQEISSYLEKRPLIKKVKVRAVLLPYKKYNIYVEEFTPWAIYKEMIIDIEANVIVSSPQIALTMASTALKDLYEINKDLDKSFLINIISSVDLDRNKLKVLKAYTEALNLNLEASQNAIKLIEINQDQNLIFHTKKFRIFAGVFDSKDKDAVAKFQPIARKLAEFDKLDYVDLSLKNKEVIVGLLENEQS